MKKLSLDLDLSKISGDPAPSIKGIWETFIVAGSRTAFKDGVDLKMQSRLIKIIDKLTEGGSIDLEDAEYEVLKDIKDRAKFDPSFSRIGSQILSSIEKAA